MVPWTLGLVLAALDDVEAKHFVIYFLLQFFKIDYQLVTILIKSRSIFSLNKAMDLQLLVYHVFNLLHCL